MARKVVLPKISDCSSPAPRSSSLTENRVVQALFMFAVVALLGLAHVQLNFAIRDMKMRSRQLQEQRQVMQRQIDRVAYERECLCSNERLREIARKDLKMEELDPRTQAVASVPESVRVRYSDTAMTPAPLSREVDLAGAAVAAAQGPMQKVLFALVDANKAYAAGE